MLDSYGRKINYLRLSVTDKCNLRCRYCMPAEGVSKRDHADMLTEEEMISAVEAAASLGITKLRISGGEPLVKKNILSICRRAAGVKGIEELCLTTNGSLLPLLAKELVQAGVRRVNISLDSLKTEKYAQITRGGKLELALAGLESALNAGFEQVKINTVLIGGFNDDEIPDLARLAEHYGVDLRFIELMPMTGGDEFGPEAYLPASAVLDALPELEDMQRREGVAQMYRLPGAKGSIGLISAVSGHFCGECNRIRLTADGKLKPCLHCAEEYNIGKGQLGGYSKIILGQSDSKRLCQHSHKQHSTAGDEKCCKQEENKVVVQRQKHLAVFVIVLHFITAL